MLKRGYDRGEKTIEFLDGNVDLVLYNNAGTSFYFFRLHPDVLLEEGIIGDSFIYPEHDIVDKEPMEKYLGRFSVDYYTLCEQLFEYATGNNYNERYEM